MAAERLGDEASSPMVMAGQKIIISVIETDHAAPRSAVMRKIRINQALLRLAPKR
jgi:hypothetical protein